MYSSVRSWFSCLYLVRVGVWVRVSVRVRVRVRDRVWVRVRVRARGVPPLLARILGLERGEHLG